MSDTVKLIIEIPKDTAKEIKDNAMFAESIASQIKWDVTSAIVNSTTLDDVKAEIEASMYCDKDTRLVENANASGLKKALEIIDNIGKGDKE